MMRVAARRTTAVLGAAALGGALGFGALSIAGAAHTTHQSTHVAKSIVGDHKTGPVQAEWAMYYDIKK